MPHNHIKIRYPLIIIILILTILALYPLSLRLTGQIRLFMANNAMENGYYGLAAERLKKASRHLPHDFGIKNQLGRVYHKLASLRKSAREEWPLLLKSRDYYIMAEQANPLDADTAYGMARTEMRLERLHNLLYPGEAEKPYNPLPWFRKALDLRPSSISYHYAMAFYMSRKNMEELPSVISGLTRIYPSAYSRLRKERFWNPFIEEAAGKGIEQAIEEGVNPREAHMALSLFLAEKKDWQAAIERYTQALRYRSFANGTSEYFHLGSLYLKINDLEKAELYFTKGLDRSNSREKDFERLYSLYRREKRQHEFTRFYTSAKRNIVTTSRMDILLARTLIELADLDNARDILQATVKHNPTAEAYYWLAMIAEKQEDWDTMELAIQKATVFDRRNSRYHAIFSGLLNRLGKLEKAEKEADLVIDTEPKPSPWSYSHRAGIRWRREDYKGAAMDWERAARIKPDHAPFHARAAEAFLLSGDPEKALLHYKSAVDIDPGNDKYRKRYNDLREKL
ncbi:MAG: tetratricopeptide repeat protein [Deltaproteobacteria bacterium]|nr:tetratricopeptide repeat protein [Deltaproteobacteria bacterium]